MIRLRHYPSSHSRLKYASKSMGISWFITLLLSQKLSEMIHGKPYRTLDFTLQETSGRKVPSFAPVIRSIWKLCLCCTERTPSCTHAMRGSSTPTNIRKWGSLTRTSSKSSISSYRSNRLGPALMAKSPSILGLRSSTSSIAAAIYRLSKFR